MFIAGLGTATPPQRYKQTECWAAVQVTSQFQRLTPRSRAILRKVLNGNNGIETRHLAFDSLHEAFDLIPNTLHERFIRNAPQAAAQAAERALANAAVRADEIDAVLISTCTGYLCPGLTSYVNELLGLRPDVMSLDLVGQGCGAALPNFRTGEALLSSGRCKRVLSICVEICSAAFYLDDDPGVLISACLFGDGAGAAVLADEPSRNSRRVEWKSAASLLVPGQRELLRFEQRDGMLRNILGLEVPSLAARYADELLTTSLARAGVSRRQIAGWIWHAGGRDVLLALQERLGLSDDDIHWSAGVLREFGNVSSPSVYFVLESALAGAAPEGDWWMSSFGAGFSCHGALLAVGPA